MQSICDKVCVILWMRKHSYVQVYKISGVDCRKQLCTTYIYSVTYYVKPRGGNEKRGRLVQNFLIIHYYILPRIVVVGTYGMTGTSNCLPIIVQLEAKIIKYDVFNVQCSI